MYPTCSPHTGRILLLSKPIYSIRKLTQLEHLSRMVNACYFRNLFPFCRKPYVTADPFRAYFVEQLVIPKVVRAVKRGFELEHFVVSVVPDESFKPIEMENYDAIFALPVKVDFRTERKKILHSQYVNCMDSHARQLYVGRVLNDGGDDAFLLRELSEEIISLASDIEILESDPTIQDNVVEGSMDEVPLEVYIPPTAVRNVNEDALTQEEIDFKKVLDSYSAATVEIRPSSKNIVTPTDGLREKNK